MDAGLVFDIGMNTAQDTRFYLEKGFRVVAVEANPRLCSEVRSELASAIADGQLIVVEGAIAETDEEQVDFLLFEDWDVWGSLDNHYARRNIVEKKLGHRRIPVRVLHLEALLERYGVPYYLKVDAEGIELACVGALRPFSDRPRFVSVEVDYMRSDVSEAMLGELVGLGYTRFKIIAQDAGFPSLSRERPQREGLSCDHVFEPDSSGPFGEDTPGAWRDVHWVRAAFAAGLDTLTWHDLHAAR